LNKTDALCFIAKLIILSLLSAHPVLADDVIVANGDSLSGKIIGLSNNILTLKTGYSEPIKIKFDSVRQINSSEPVEIHLTGGEVLKGRITTGESGQILVAGGEGRDEVTVAMANIAALNPPPKKPVTWQGNVTLGGNLQSGNSETMNIAASLSAVRRSEKDRFVLSLLYNRAEDDGEKTAENIFSQLKYDYFLSQKWYLYLNIDMLSDEFNDINLRTTVGPGVGYQIWEADDKSLSLEAGVSYTSEDLDEGKDTSWLSARAGVNYMQKLIDRVLFTDQFVIYPDLEDTGEYLLRNEAAIVTDIGAKLAFKLSNIWERDSAPDPGLEEDDLTWILGLQYSF